MTDDTKALVERLRAESTHLDAWIRQNYPVQGCCDKCGNEPELYRAAADALERLERERDDAREINARMRERLSRDDTLIVERREWTALRAEAPGNEGDESKPEPPICMHGNLRRVCPICERDEEIAQLRAEARATSKEVLEEIGVYLIDIDQARAEADHMRALLRWVYRAHGAAWAMVCDEEIEIAALAEEGDDRWSVPLPEMPPVPEEGE